jgi:inward rectifier potassium channel
MSRRAPRHPRDMPVRIGVFELTSRGARRYDWRDPYHVALTLSWRAFLGLFVVSELLLNALFGVLYWVRPGCIVNLPPGSLSLSFFFSVETLATVGYGVMAPATLYGHIISAIEIITGTGFTAIVTGLTFVRFSRPRSRVLYPDRAVVARYNGVPTLMVRIGNGRTTPLTQARAKLSILLAERSAEGEFYRRVYDLHLVRDEFQIFAITWTLMHPIDDRSPLAGYDADRLAREDGRLFLSVSARDHALCAEVHDTRAYGAADIQFGHRYAEAVRFEPNGRTAADLTRISETEPDPALAAIPSPREPAEA